SPSAARASAPPIAEPPIPATTRPAGVSQSCMIADSTRHTASRRCSATASTSASWPVESTFPISSRVIGTAAGVVVTPSLISAPSRRWMWSRSSLVSRLELDRPVRQAHPREDTRTARHHVVSPQLDAFAEHRAAGHLAARSDPAARPHDAVAQLAAFADLGAAKDNGALHGAARADRDVLAEHDEAPDLRARRHAAAALEDGGRDRPTLDVRPLGHRHEAAAHPLLNGRRDVPLDDVEGALQVALGGSDVHPVALRGVAVEAVADEARPHLPLYRDVAVGGDQL